jgi:hydroxymethylpyrimidine/phosphomethylpyrimidine kinase
LAIALTPIALTIAGSDPSGGAGIQADLKTFHQLHVFGTSAITLITVQNTTRVSRVEVLDARLVAEQIQAVLEDLPPQAVKTGALGSEAIIEVVAAANLNCPLVVDPVMMSKHGAPLAPATALRKLLTKAALVTPNLDEAAALTGMPVTNPTQMRDAAKRIADLGVPSVLVKGGHLTGSEASNAALDILFHHGEFHEFTTRRIDTRHTHGTGCTYSAAITAFLAKGLDLVAAVREAKRFVQAAIETNPGLGKGSGPLNHWV